MFGLCWEILLLAVAEEAARLEFGLLFVLTAFIMNEFRLD